MKRSAPVTPWRDVKQELEAEGWEVEFQRVWRARARRGTHIEDGLATDLDEAFAELRQLTRQDDCEGCP
jgi:hypothetical protein